MNNLDQIMIHLTMFHEDNEMIHHWHSGIKSIAAGDIANNESYIELRSQARSVRDHLKETCSPIFLLEPSIITKVKFKFTRTHDDFIYKTYSVVEDSLITLNDAKTDISGILNKDAFDIACITAEMMVLSCGALVWIDDLKKLIR